MDWGALDDFKINPKVTSPGPPDTGVPKKQIC